MKTCLLAAAACFAMAFGLLTPSVCAQPQGAMPGQIVCSLAEARSRLQDHRYAHDWQYILSALGFVDDPEACEAVNNFIERFRGKTVDASFTGPWWRVVDALRPLGLLAQQCDRAYEFVTQGCRSEYWQKMFVWQNPEDGKERAFLDSLVGGCIMAVGASGRVGHDWVDDLIKSSSKGFLYAHGHSILACDRSIWQIHKYGLEDFRQGFSVSQPERYNEYCRSTDRAGAIAREVIPPDMLEGVFRSWQKDVEVDMAPPVYIIR